MSDTKNEAQPRLGDGELTVVIDGHEYKLKPYFQAARMLSSKYDGLMGAMRRVANIDVDVIADVISLGVGYSGSKRPPPDFAEKLWAAGLTDDTGGIVDKCVLYLRMLSAGGKLPADPSSKDSSERPQTG